MKIKECMDIHLIFADKQSKYSHEKGE